MPEFTRKQWIKVLALSDSKELMKCWGELNLSPTFSWLSKPETGLLTVRSKTGGTGKDFNLGDIVVSRSTIRLEEDGIIGHSTQVGSDLKKSEVSAILDALLQTNLYQQLRDRVLVPLQESYRQKINKRNNEISSSKVDFYTMVRGE